MQPALKTRLLGAAVLIALLVIVVPLFFSGKPGGGGSQSISLDIPQTPNQTLKTRTMSVASTPSVAASAPASGDKLATVEIPSRVPQEVQPDTAASVAGARAASASTSADEPPSAPPDTTPKASAKTSTDQHAETAEAHPGKAAVGQYRITLGAYADQANAKRLVAKVGQLGYPVQLQATRIGGKPAARVDVGPFDSRAAAESARLKLRGKLPRAPVKLVSAPKDQTHDAPAPAKASKARAGGWAVQVVAYSKHAEADKLRDKLRAAGFDSYVDDVRSGGHTLWRVRVGPLTQRGEALSTQKRLKDKFPRLKGVVVDVP